MERSTTKEAMIGGMKPVLKPGGFVFVTVPDDQSDLIAQSLASFREDEGLSLVLPLALAEAETLDVSQPMACISLHVYSSLEGVGLTAAVATVLADHGIPCNMIAAYNHDHAFVPLARAQEALDLLLDLQARYS